MAFEPVKLIHPKTGVVVTATTAVDFTTFRFNDGYVPADVAKSLVDVEGADKKYPKLAEGLKQVEAIEAEEKGEEPAAEETPADDKGEATTDEKTEAPKSSSARGGAKSSAAKSGTDASGNQVGVN